MNNKGQYSGSRMLTLTWVLIMVAIAVAVSLILLAQFQQEAYTTYTNTNNSSGETPTYNVSDKILMNNSYYRNLTTAYAQLNPVCTDVYAFHSTNSSYIGSGNYTLSNCKVIASDTVQASLNQTSWNFTYDLKYDQVSDASDSVGEVVTTVGEVPDWLSLLVVVIFITIVIGLIGMIRAKGRD